MTSLRLTILCSVTLFSAGPLWCAPRVYPEPRYAKTGLEGDWVASPIVAVGEVVNVTSYGKQTVKLARTPHIHKLYWCLGDFQTAAVVKGELGPGLKKYLWASTLPGCKLIPDEPHFAAHWYKTRAWFLREEAGFLRPTFDYGTWRYLGFRAAWGDGPALPPRQKLGVLLLTPKAVEDSLADYAPFFDEVAWIVCGWPGNPGLLGKPECTERIGRLAELGDPTLRAYACLILGDELGAPCQPTDPLGIPDR